MKLNLTILAIILALFFRLSAQSTFPDSIINKPRLLRIMFYNAENFFDTENDSIKNDDEFLPNQGKFWNRSRYYTKQKHISQVITGIGGWSPPEIIGLCEIENRRVLDDFVRYAPINKLHYNIIHKESPDLRGIDVALLYRQGHFFPIAYNAIEIRYPFSHSKTRDILYVKGHTKQHDTLHIFVNHWPSRWGGQLETERKRMFVASVLRKAVDSVFQTNHRANIIIMGDLNDYPENKSVSTVLNAKDEFETIHPDELYNLAAYLQNVKHLGSHKHNGKWGVLDQFIVSGALLDKKNTIYTSTADVYIYNADFLLEEDKQYAGFATNRTYIGYKYHGGYSDHLPVFLDILRKEL